MSTISRVGGAPEIPEPVAEEAPAAAPAVEPKPGAVRRLVDSGIREAEKAVVKEITKPHEVSKEFKLFEGAKAGVRMKEDIFLPDEAAVKDDPLRKATTEKLTAEGKSIAWGRVEGEVSLGSDWKTESAGTTIGFPGGAKLGYSLLTPVAYKHDGKVKPLETAKDVLKQQTVDLPVTPRGARDLPPGAEFKLSGELRAGLTAASGGLSMSASGSGNATIEVKRLDGDKVSVVVTKVRGSEAGAGAPVGPAAASLGASATEGEVDRFTLDLSKGQAQATYAALMRGDTGAARAVAATRSGGVTADAAVEKWTGEKVAAGLATKLANGFGAGLSIYDEKISERDGRLTGSPMRQRLTTEAKGRGEAVTWHGSGGALEASFGTETQVGVVTAGFSTKGLLEYHAVAPSKGGASARLGPTDLPLDSAKARGLAEGTEVTIRGAGSIAASAGSGFGASAGVAGGVTLGYGVTAKTELKASKDIAVNVTKLAGEKVRVILADRDTASAGLTVAAEAGLKVDREAIPGGSALEGIVGDKLAGEAKKAVEKELTKYLSAKATFGTTIEKTGRDVAAFDLDLSTEAGRTAYDKLLRLDAREAEKLSAVAGSGVSKVGALEEEITTKRAESNVTIFGQKIIETKAERRDRIATLVNGPNTKTIAEHEFVRSRSGLVKRGNVEWEAVQVKDSATGKAERFLHMKLDKLEDDWTSHDERTRAERFAGVMGAKVTERHVKNENPSWWDRNINPAAHGKTTTHADIYFTEGAMAKVGTTSKEGALLAYAKSSSKLEGDGKPLPGWFHSNAQVRAQARQVLEQYDPFDDGDRSRYMSHYKRLTGRDLLDDHATYREAKDFAGYVARARTGNETERLKAFADLGSKRGFDFHATVGAMNEIAGEDVVLLNRYEVQGKDFKIVTSSEGGIASPDTAVAEAFAPK